MRCWTSTWVAASPTPLDAYMVSSIPSTSWRTASSTTATGAAFLRRRGSGYSRIASFVMGVMRAISCFRPKNVAKVPPLLNLMPSGGGAQPGADRHGQSGNTSQSSAAGAQYTSQPGTMRQVTRGSKTHADSHQILIAPNTLIALAAGCRPSGAARRRTGAGAGESASRARPVRRPPNRDGGRGRRGHRPPSPPPARCHLRRR